MCLYLSVLITIVCVRAQHCGDADANEPDADDVAGEPDGSGEGGLRVGCACDLFECGR